MSMNLSLSASTNGPDDAEALALALESVATQIRTGGGDCVNSDGSMDLSVAGQTQTVFLAFVASP